MALQKDIEFDTGVTLDDAYIKITSIVFNYQSPRSVSIRVSIFRNSASYSSGKPEVERLEYICREPEYTTYFANEKFTEGDPQALAYEYLKTMDFYSGALSI